MKQIINNKPLWALLVGLAAVIWGYILPVDASDTTLLPRKKKAVIVIDPGHGGHDHGARGAGGTTEKEVTLTLAQMIASCMSKDYKVILTRTGDYWLDGPGRTAIANHHKAALFLSIHASGSYLHQTGGAAVLFHKTGPDQGALPASLASLSESDKKGPRVWDQVQNSHTRDSRLMAETIHAQMMAQNRFSNIAVKGAPLAVTAGADMPAALVEIGYLTKPAHEKELEDDDYLSDLAGEICRGMKDFLE
jgi:N-acetylmuramoyl-L-alanine amidase